MRLGYRFGLATSGEMVRMPKVLRNEKVSKAQLLSGGAPTFPSMLLAPEPVDETKVKLQDDEDTIAMTNSTMRRIEQIAASAGFQKLFDNRLHRVTWRIVCSRVGCGAKAEHAWNPRTSPEIMVTNMTKQGWYVDFSKEPLCPAHHHERKHTTKNLVVTKPTMQRIVAAALPEEVTVAEPNFKLTKQIMDHLDAQFDTVTGQFRVGWSDDVIAKTTGAHIDIVRRIRVDAFGELSEDPELAALKNKLGHLETQALTFTDQIDELRRRIDMFVAKKKMGA